MNNIKLSNSQTGVTLLSMLIGVVISLLTMAALFVLFQQSTVQGTQMREDIDLEGQLATILLSIQQDVQSAGYGMDVSDTATFTKPQVVLVSGSGNLFKLYWRYLDQPTDAAYTCKGFEEYLDASDGNKLKMRWLNEIDCTKDVTLSGSLWSGANASKVQLAAVFAKETSSLLNGSSLPSTKEACWPYSTGTAEEHQVLKIEALNSIEISNVRQKYTFTYCLTNL